MLVVVDPPIPRPTNAPRPPRTPEKVDSEKKLQFKLINFLLCNFRPDFRPDNLSSSTKEKSGL
jgi:hypothetical protein